MIFSSAGSLGILASMRTSVTRPLIVAGTVAERGLLSGVLFREGVVLLADVCLRAGFALLLEVASLAQGSLTTQGWIGCAWWAATPCIAVVNTPRMNKRPTQACLRRDFADASVLFVAGFDFDIDLRGRACIVCRTTVAYAKAKNLVGC